MSLIIRPSIINNNLHQQCRWHGFATTTTLEETAAQKIITSSQQAISERKEFHLVLAGGTTPRRVYELLRNKNTNWSAWHIYYGDERCLPLDHAERNNRMAALALLDHVSIPASQIHTIHAELGSDAAAIAYAMTISKIDNFDLVLLGLGEDGHTASLFPHHEWGTSLDAPDTLAVQDAPKPPSERVSLSAQRLSKTRELIFLVSGETKRQAIKDWRKGENIPAAAITPACGVDVYVENALLAN